MTAIHHRGSRAGLYAPALLVPVAAGALLWAVTHVPQREWAPRDEVPVSFAGEHYRVGPEELRWLESFSTLHFTEGEAAAREIVAAEIDRQLDRTFSRARERLPSFLDWYYSLAGEYSRLAMAALSLAGLAEPGYVAREAASRLLPEEEWAAELASLEQRAAQRLAAHDAEMRAGWVAALSRRLAAHRVPAPLPGADAANERTLALDALLQEIAAREQAGLEARLSVSTVAAGGAAAAPALWRAAAARRAAGRAAARVAGRTAARAGTAAAGGAAVCAPGGPAAAACALLAGAGAWLAADWALLEFEEHRHRAELEAALEEGLETLRAQIEAELLGAYEAIVGAHYDDVRREIERSFVPAHAGEAAARAGDAAAGG